MLIKLNKYRYNGPVMSFGTCVQNNWIGETMAVSKEKARSNLIFQWKKKNNRIPGSRITLPGEVTLVG